MKQIYDAHAHLGTEKERKIRAEQGITTLFCASDKKEAEFLLDMKKREEAYASFGIHPWNVMTTAFKDMESFLRAGEVVGEIGLDSVWCTASLFLQEEVFIKQLALAFDEKKPVILHTKGQEKRIGEIIKDYPNRYLIHWYSDEREEGLDRYLSLGCYFTIGPDGKKNLAAKRLIKEAPLNRLLVETDGWSAVCWALGEMSMNKMRKVLERNIDVIAEEKGVDRSRVEEQMEENFLTFIGKRNCLK
ncbi:TatD family hydrolase [Lachnospiraceae bacterium 62-35]